MKPSIYLDYAAATPLDQAARAAAEPFLRQEFYNPSAAYQSARRVRAKLEAARAKVADVLGVKDQEILFTAGGTEANNIAIHGVMRNFPGAHVITSAVEHESVLEAVRRYDHSTAPVAASGVIDLVKLQALIKDDTVLISCMYANNEIGTIQPIKKIAQLVAKEREARRQNGNTTPLYLHTDACQAANYLDLQVPRLSVDLMTLNGGKIYSYKQSGGLYASRAVELAPYTVGGGQERGIRSGTENIAASVAFATMLQKVQADRAIECVRLQQIRDDLIATLSQKLPHMTINGTTKKRLPNNINISLESADGERLLMELDEAGLMVATGSACSASSDKPSHVLLAIGLNKGAASSSLRITLGRATTEADIAHAADILIDRVTKHKSRL